MSNHGSAAKCTSFAYYVCTQRSTKVQLNACSFRYLDMRDLSAVATGLPDR